MQPVTISVLGLPLSPQWVARRRVASPWLFQVANFCFWSSLYFYVPILPVYAERQGASLTLVGVMLSAYGIVQFLLRVPTGVASDLLGRRRPFVFAGLAAAGLGALGFVWTPAPPLLVAARAITGLAACGWVIITVMYASYYEPARATRAIALLGVTNGLGQAMATYVGGAAAQAWGWHAPFYLAAGTALLGVGAAALCVEASSDRAAAAVSWRRLLAVGTAPSLLIVAGLSAINTFGTFTTIFGFTPVFASRALGATRADLGVLAASGVAAFTLAQLATASLTTRLGYRGSVSAAFLLNGAMTAIIPVIPTMTAALGLAAAAGLPLLIGSQVLAGFTRGLLQAILMSLSILAVHPRERATAMGVYQAIYAAGMFLGPLVGGRLADTVGLPSVFWTAGALSAAAALIMLVTALPTAPPRPTEQ